jgi:HEAT repeat protein
MPGKRSFDQQLAALDEVKHLSPEAAVEPLRKALTHRNNYMVAKAADLTAKCRLVQLLPELLAAFDRFFTDPLKTDPQCWAKNALSRALAALDCQDSDVFLRGMRHIQLEPVWGGSEDTAGTLRGTCALALVQCRSLPETELLLCLIELLVDKEKSVRVEAVRAIEEVGSQAAALLLRLRAILASDEPEVLGACYGGILRIEGAAAIPWIARFLTGSDETASEAAWAIADQRSAQAFTVLRERFAVERDGWFRSVLLSAIALTRQPEALNFLFQLIRTEPLNAEAAITALVESKPAPEVLKQLEERVSGNPGLARVFEAQRKVRG